MSDTDLKITPEETNGLLDNDQNHLAPHYSEIENIFKPLETDFKNLFTEALSSQVDVAFEEIFPSTKDALIAKIASSGIFCSQANFTGDASSTHLYTMGEEQAIKIASRILGEDVTELEENSISSLNALFSKVAAATNAEIGKKSNKNIMLEDNLSAVDKESLNSVSINDFIVLSYKVKYDDENINFYELIEESFLKSIVNIDGSLSNENDGLDVKPKPAYMDKPVEIRESTGFNSSLKVNMPNVQEVKLPNLVEGNVKSESRNISLLMDVMMELTVELGRTRWQIRDILGMGEGTIIELDKLAGEPVDILVNHNLIARGEVVVIDENFGVRVTEIISSMDKIAGKL